MSLFDDDFYSTRVSRRAREDGRRDWRFGGRGGWRRWRGEGGLRPVHLAFISSMVSALGAVLLFGLIFGFGRGGGGSGAVVSVAGVLLRRYGGTDRAGGVPGGARGRQHYQ